MPIATLTTNLAEDSFPTNPKEFNIKLAKFLGELLNRPISGMFVQIIYSANFTVDANFDPAVILDVSWLAKVSRTL